MRIKSAAVAALRGLTLGGAAPSAAAPVKGEAPLVFEANRDQAAPEIAFASRADGYEVLLDSEGARLVLVPGISETGAVLRLSFRDSSPSAAPGRFVATSIRRARRAPGSNILILLELSPDSLHCRVGTSR